MTRKKVELTYITNDSKRKATFKKRQAGLVKKVEELSILCGIEACAMIYMPGNPHPEVWPSEEGVESLLSRFNAVPEVERRQRMLDQSTFLRMRIAKGEEKLKKMKSENRKAEINLHMSQYFFNGGNIFNNANMIDLNDILHMANQNLEETKRKISMMQAQMETPVPENGGKIMTRGKQALLNQVQGSQVNVMNAMKNFNQSMGNTSGSGKDVVPTLEDACLNWLA